MTIQDLVNRFRHALNKLDWGSMPISFRRFPTATCGNISDILANYLQSKGVNDIKHVCGVLPDGQSHAWLVVDLYIIDITADQFPCVTQEVIFSKSSDFHRKFNDLTCRKAGFTIGARDTEDLDKVYRAALVQLESQGTPTPY
jgi:hypothetical protein